MHDSISDRIDERIDEGRDRLLIVDGHGLAYRAFYAMERQELSAPDGTPTGVLTGFMNMLSFAEEEVRPRAVAVAFDAPGPTFRHEMLPQYKATRKPSPEEFKAQVPLLQELLRLMGYPLLIQSGVEADDVMASLALRATEKGWQAVLLSSDKDLMQVLRPGVLIMRPLKSGVSSAEIYSAADFEAKKGFSPSSVPDYLALLGDKADNVPGVDGIGEKTAGELISRWPTLEGVFDGLSELRPAVRKKLEASGLEAAQRSRALIRLRLDVPLDLDRCLSAPADPAAALALAERLALRKVARRIMAGPTQAAPAAGPEVRFVPLAELAEAYCTQGPPVLAMAPLQDGRVQVAAEDGRAADCSGEEALALLERVRPAELLLYDGKAMAARGLTVPEVGVWDLRTAHYLLHPDVAEKTFPSLIAEGEAPAPALFRLRQGLDAAIARHHGLRDVMEGIDLPLIPVLLRMERWGVRLDPSRFAALQEELADRIRAIEVQVEDMAGTAVNLNSPKQVADLLFVQLGFAPEGKTKGKTGFSTSAAVLEHLAHLPGGEVPALLLEHRELSKMQSGFVVPLQKAAEEGEGVIHTTFEPALTGTGRLSSRDPNLQNIPAFGQWAERIKQGLVPVREGNVFVAADYSQIELRVLAHMSREPRLVEAFRNGRDIHRETASWVFSMAPEFVTPELRRVAKMINFGLLYGMSAFGLAERLDMPRGEASMIVKRYFEALPGVQSFLKDIVKEAHAAGFARTLAGRIRPVDEVTAPGRGGLDRVLVNTPIQGTAADIARKAMVDFDRAFRHDGEVRLFLQVHDSLVCECPAARAEEVGRSLREIMMNAATLSLPLEVQLKTGSSLAEA